MPRRRAHTGWHGLERLEDRRVMALVSWDGGASTNSWHDAANWSGDQLPGANDDVVIDVPASAATVVHSSSVLTLVRSITNFEGLTLSGGTISPGSGGGGNWVQHGPMTLSGGTVGGSGNLYVKAGLNWTGGSMTGSGRTIIEAGGVGTSSGLALLARTLYVDGTYNWQSGDLQLSGGALVVRPTGTFNASSPGSAFGAGGVNVIGNNGTFRRVGTSGTTSTLGVTFDNSGTVQVLQGTLRLIGGGTSLSGAIDVGASRTLILANLAYVVGGGSAISGAGTFTLNSGVHVLAGAFSGVGALRVQGATARVFGPTRTVSALHVSGGTLELHGILTAGASGVWTGGTISGPDGGSGRLRVPAGVTLGISGVVEKYLADATLEVLGTANWSGARLNLTDAVIENKGVFNASGDRIRALAGTARLENSGDFRKLGGLTLIFSNTSGGIRLNNLSNGGVDVVGGTLTLLGGGVSTGAFTGAAAGALVIGGVSYTIAGGSITTVPSVTVSGLVTWTAGSLGGAGLVIVSPGATLTLSGGAGKSLSRSLTNNGTLTWSGGTLQLNDATIINAAGATMNLSVAGGLVGVGTAAITNSGTLVKTGASAAAFGNSNVQFSNFGTLTIQGGSLNLQSARVTQVSGTVLTGGTWNVLNGAAFNLVGATLLTNNATVTLSGTGVKFDAFRFITKNNGTIAVTSGNYTLVSNGLQLTNAGTLTVGAGATLSVQGKITLEGTSRVNVSIASPVSFGRVIASGAVELAGQTTAAYTGTPAAGLSTLFIFGNSRTGQFTTTTPTGLPAGRTAAVTYEATGARWVVS
ncbi:MAG: beta strand repeat-containing protein [Phycisphaerales bacterium]